MNSYPSNHSSGRTNPLVAAAILGLGGLALFFWLDRSADGGADPVLREPGQLGELEEMGLAPPAPGRGRASTAPAELKLAAPQTVRAPATNEAPDGEPPAASGFEEQVLARMEALEQRLNALEEREDSVLMPGDDLLARSLAPEEAEISTQDLRRSLLDVSLGEVERAEAWSELRYRDDGWDDAVVLEAIQLGLNSSDPNLRADIWRNADSDKTNDLLVDPMLQSLANDPDAGVREEAAETLGAYLVCLLYTSDAADE